MDSLKKALAWIRWLCVVHISTKYFTFLEPNPLGLRLKLNVHKTFRRRPERLLNVLCTFNLRLISRRNFFENSQEPTVERLHSNFYTEYCLILDTFTWFFHGVFLVTKKLTKKNNDLLNTGHKSKVHKTFGRRCLGCLLNVLYTFPSRP